MKQSLPLVALALLLGAWPTPAVADDVAEAGRSIVEKNAAAIVTIQMVISETFSWGDWEPDESEFTLETTATVIDASGLIVTSLSQTDPARIFESIFDEEDDLKIETDITDVKIILEDGEEMPAEIVLRDRDLDLVFLRPENAPAVTFSHVDLSAPAEPRQFDRIMTLKRLGKVADRRCAGTFPRIEALMTRPRLFYILGSSQSNNPGEPAFTLDGKCIGITVLRSIKMPISETTAIMSMEDLNMTVAILPARDILESADQAPPASRSVKNAE